MATQQSTSIVPAIRIQPELILPRDPGWTPSEAPCPLFIQSGDRFTEASESEVIVGRTVTSLRECGRLAL